MLHANIVLIGFMGCGKTTIGRLIAEEIGWSFTDTDIAIEEKENRTITAIFEADGEVYFRKVEQETLREESEKGQQVIATGGGAVKDPQNVQILKDNGTIIYMRWSPDSLYQHLKTDDTRPLLNGYKGEARKTRIQNLLAEREPMYRGAADLIVDLDGLPPELAAEKIISALAAKNS